MFLHEHNSACVCGSVCFAATAGQPQKTCININTAINLAPQQHLALVALCLSVAQPSTVLALN